MKIKSVLNILMLLSIALVMTRCEEETARPREYPRLKTLFISNISDSGAVFNAELYSMGTEEILDYGFVWGTSPYISYYNSDRISLGMPEGKGTFSACIRTTLKKDVQYYVEPYIRTDRHTVYGKIISFKSMGSLAPLIRGFVPDSAAWVDTIRISGRNFSWVANQNIVKLNGIECPIFSSTDSTVTVNIPVKLNIRESLLTVEIAGNTASLMQKKFKLILPTLNDFTPKLAQWGDALLITGKNLHTISYSGNYIRLGSFNVIYVKVRRDSVWVKVPNELNLLNSSLTLSLNGILLSGKEAFQLKEPSFTFSPAEGTWGDKITLSGKFHLDPLRNTFFIGDKQASVVTSGANATEISVPQTLSTGESRIKYKVAPFEVLSAETFRLRPPVITSFSPSSGPGYTSVTITGNYFGTDIPPVVRFGNEIATVRSWNNNSINVYAPLKGFGPVNISVTIGTQSAVSAQTYNLLNPRITGINPLTGTFKDQITITGENFIPNGTTVMFGNIYATVKSSTSTTLIVEVPARMDSIPQNINLLTSNNTSAASTEKFTLLPPEVYSVGPLPLIPGGELTITGKNFNSDLSNESVIMDMIPFKIKSATSSQIIATVPSGLARGSFRFKVFVNGYTRFSGEIANVNSPWLRIPSPALRTYNSDYGSVIPIAAGGTSDKGYLCSLVDGGDTYKFDPNTKAWTKLASKPSGVGTYLWNFRNVSCNESLYLIYGNTPVFTVFNPANESWTSINRSLTYNESAIVFSLAGKIYFGTYVSYNPTVYPFYEIDPLQGYTMRTMANFPVSLNTMPITCFSMNNIGYVLFGNNNFWKYDPVNNLWTKLSNFPGRSRSNASSFILGQYAYIVGGVTGSEYLNDLWRYDALSDSWTLISNIPNARAHAAAFTLNGKAYIGYGRSGANSLFDFYEYDPNL